MKIQTRCGFKRPKGRSCEAFPFSSETLRDIGKAVTDSLKGHGKSGLSDPTYGNKSKFISSRPMVGMKGVTR